MAKVLVTGSSGFVGQHLIKYLIDKGDEVYKCSRKFSTELNAVQCDLANINDTDRLFWMNFDKIFHLAAQSSVHVSWERPWETIHQNINSVNNLLHVFAGTETKIIFAGTSEVYKPSLFELTEESELDNRSPYALSKLTTDSLIRMTAEQQKVNCCLLRLFSHTGIGQTTNFALSSWAKQLAQMKYRKLERKIQVGNLDIKRDYLNVRDVLDCYSLVSEEQCFGEVYNVCSGEAYLMRDLLHQLIEISKLDVEICVNEKFVRKNDIGLIQGSHDKIAKKFGWEPKIPIKQTLTELYNYWEEKVRNEHV